MRLCTPGSPAQRSLCTTRGPGTISSELQVSRCLWGRAAPAIPAALGQVPFPRWLQGSWSTQSQQQNPNVLAAACGFPTDIPAGIMGDRAHPVTQSQVLRDQVLRTLTAGLQGKGLIGIWTLCRGAAAKGTSLGTAWKSCCQKIGTPEQCRCLGRWQGTVIQKYRKLPSQCSAETGTAPGNQFRPSFHPSSLFLQHLHLPDWAGTTLWVALGH